MSISNQFLDFSAGQIEEALVFAQSQMSEAGENNPEVLSELERTLALLAFEKPQNSPFADLLEQSHRIVSIATRLVLMGFLIDKTYLLAESGQRTERGDPGGGEPGTHTTQNGFHPEVDPVGSVRTGQEECQVPEDDGSVQCQNRSEVRENKYDLQIIC